MDFMCSIDTWAHNYVRYIEPIMWNIVKFASHLQHAMLVMWFNFKLLLQQAYCNAHSNTTTIEQCKYITIQP